MLAALMAAPGSHYSVFFIVDRSLSTISAKSKSVEVESAQTDIPGPVNIVQLMTSADIKISVLIHTLLVKTMKNKTF